MHKPQRYFIIISLLVLLVIALWQSPRSPLQDFVADDKVAATKQYPVAYLNNIKTTQYNEQGQVAHTLTAKKISHYEQTREGKPDTYAILEQPIIIIFNHDEPNALPWHASSNHGRSINNGEELILEGDVVLVQKPENSHAQVTNNHSTAIVTTEQLRIKPNQQYAETDKPVMIKNSAGTTTSTGLAISLDTQKIELRSKVRGRYDIR